LRLLVINQYYPPDVASTGRIAAEICSGLVKRGIEVHVVTGQPSYTESSSEAPQCEVLEGVYIHRVSLRGARGRTRIWTRIGGYSWFMLGAWKLACALVQSQNFDKVVTFHNPPFVGLIGAHLARRYKLQYIYILQDIHPDWLLAAGWYLPSPIVWFWETLNRWIFKHAEVIVVLGEGMKHTLEGKGVPAEQIKVIPLWGLPELDPQPRSQSIRRELGISDEELLLLYSGNMGIMHPLDPIVDAAALLQGLPVQFLFVGDGVRRAYLIERVKKEKIANVSFLPFQPQDRFVELIAASDVCFTVLKPGMERLALPSKGFTFLSAGRPLITIMSPEAEVARLVAEAECGWNVTTGQELADLIRKLINDRQEILYRGQKARKVYEERFRRELIIGEYAKVLGA